MDTSIKKAPLVVARFTGYLKQKGFSPRTVVTYLNYLKPFVRYLTEKEVASVGDVTKEMVKQYQSFLYHHPKRLSLRTQGHHLVGLRSFFNFLESSDLILSNPTTQIEFPKKPIHLPRDIFSEREVKKLLNAVTLEPTHGRRKLGFRDKAVLELLYSTGVRSGELTELKLLHLDKEEGMLRIEEGKGKKDRVVPVGDVAIHYLKLYLEHGREKLLLKGETPYLFVSNRGAGLKAADVPKLVKKYARRAGITRQVNAHMVRHSVATHMLKRRAPIRYIQELLGHASLDTTQIYTKVEISDLKKIHHQTHPRERA